MEITGGDDYPPPEGDITTLKRALSVLLKPDLYPSIADFVLRQDGNYTEFFAWPFPLVRGSRVPMLTLFSTTKGEAALSALEDLLSAGGPVRRLILGDYHSQDMPPCIECISQSPCLVELSFSLCFQSQDQANSVLPLVMDALLDASALPSLKLIDILVKASPVYDRLGTLRIPRHLSPWRLLLKPNLVSLWVSGDGVVWFAPELVDVAEEYLDARAQSGYPPL